MAASFSRLYANTVSDPTPEQVARFPPLMSLLPGKSIRFALSATRRNARSFASTAARRDHFLDANKDVGAFNSLTARLPNGSPLQPFARTRR
jgi:hypothetical protein